MRFKDLSPEDYTALLRFYAPITKRAALATVPEDYDDLLYSYVWDGEWEKVRSIVALRTELEVLAALGKED